MSLRIKFNDDVYAEILFMDKMAKLPTWESLKNWNFKIKFIPKAQKTSC